MQIHWNFSVIFPMVCAYFFGEFPAGEGRRFDKRPMRHRSLLDSGSLSPLNLLNLNLKSSRSNSSGLSSLPIERNITGSVLNTGNSHSSKPTHGPVGSAVNTLPTSSSDSIPSRLNNNNNNNNNKATWRRLDRNGTVVKVEQISRPSSKAQAVTAAVHKNGTEKAVNSSKEKDEESNEVVIFKKQSPLKVITDMILYAVDRDYMEARTGLMIVGAITAVQLLIAGTVVFSMMGAIMIGLMGLVLSFKLMFAGMVMAIG